MTRLGDEPISDEVLDEMMQEADLNGDGQIQYDGEVSSFWRHKLLVYNFSWITCFLLKLPVHFLRVYHDHAQDHGRGKWHWADDRCQFVEKRRLQKEEMNARTWPEVVLCAVKCAYIMLDAVRARTNCSSLPVQFRSQSVVLRLVRMYFQPAINMSGRSNVFFTSFDVTDSNFTHKYCTYYVFCVVKHVHTTVLANGRLYLCLLYVLRSYVFLDY